MAKITIEDVLKQFSFEDIQAAQLAKQKRELQPRKDKVIAEFQTLKTEVLAIRELDEDFAFPLKSSTKKKSSKEFVTPTDEHIPAMLEFIGGNAVTLTALKDHMKFHHKACQKFCADRKQQFKVTKDKTKKVFIARA